MIAYQVECMLNPNNKKEVLPKKIYKKNTERNIIFE